MRNLEQTLAKTLLSEYKTLQDVFENYKNTKVQKAIMRGQELLLMDIAQSIWGSNELNLHSHHYFMETLKEVAESKPSPNLAEVTSQEAHELFKFWMKCSAIAHEEKQPDLAKEWDEKSDKWLGIALEISKSKLK